MNKFQGPSNYAFGYSVKDDYSGDDFSHNEVRDGYKTEGEYRVALPDGRVQIVSYIADENGYHADVRKSVTIRAIKINSNFYTQHKRNHFLGVCLVCETLGKFAKL